MDKEYIDKHEAYRLIKNEADTHELPATKVAYERAANIISMIKPCNMNDARLIDANALGSGIHEEVEKLVDKELAAATERFGLHHSWYEKYSVMLDKLQGLRDEVNLTDKEIDSIWFGIRNNLPEYSEDRIHHVYEHAVKSACEAIQVACTARKRIENKE